MRSPLIIIFFSLIALVADAQSQKGSAKKPDAPLQTQSQKTSYGFGVLVASNLKTQAGDSIDLEAFYLGVKDAYEAKALKMKREECEGAVQQHLQIMSKRKTERIRKSSIDFLEKNKTEANVKTLPSGLQYKILNSGVGVTPKVNDQVTVHYVGKLIDGSTFESSVQRGQPITRGVSGFIKGWIEALQLMKEGDKWILYIPQELAYGPSGSQQIPAYAALIFEIELLKVN